MEAVMEALNDEDRFTVVTVCFKGKLVQLCRHRLANHVMQRVIDRATGEPEVLLGWACSHEFHTGRSSGTSA